MSPSREVRQQAQPPRPTRTPGLSLDGSQRPLLPASPMGLGSCEHRPHFPPRANVEMYPLFRDLSHWERPWCLRKLMGVAGGGGSGRWGGCITRTWVLGGQLGLALGERVQEAGITNLRAGSSLSRPCARPSRDGRTGAPGSNGMFGGHACPGHLLSCVPVEEHWEGHSEPGPGPRCPPGAQTSSAARHRECSVGGSLAPWGPGVACPPLGAPAARAPPPQQMQDRQLARPGP